MINRSIKIRKSFASIKELKSNKTAKQHITKIAKVYVSLAEECFGKNATKLFIPSDCNDVEHLEDKQNELFALEQTIRFVCLPNAPHHCNRSE